MHGHPKRLDSLEFYSTVGDRSGSFAGVPVVFAYNQGDRLYGVWSDSGGRGAQMGIRMEFTLFSSTAV